MKLDDLDVMTELIEIVMREGAEAACTYYATLPTDDLKQVRRVSHHAIAREKEAMRAMGRVRVARDVYADEHRESISSAFGLINKLDTVSRYVEILCDMRKYSEKDNEARALRLSNQLIRARGLDRWSANV